ncbi:zinc finger protein 189-like [Penaeus monodon]|uniref:zinc finger protein 189-like n=1 Tax=Penaeus monodon TaxID=6687 RepID=UPI0018A704F0|nr:zinc finger protein 189-like [Penaeus monodon]
MYFLLDISHGDMIENGQIHLLYCEDIHSHSYLFYISHVVIHSVIFVLFTIHRTMMSILPDRIPLAQLSDEEMLGTGVCIKRELDEGVTEDMYLEIKEEPYDYADEAKYKVSEVKVKEEFLFFKDLQDLRQDANEKGSCDFTEDCNDISSGGPLVAEDCGNRCSSDWDEAPLKETYEEVTHGKVDRKLKCFSCEVCGKTFDNKTYIKIHMRVHTKEKPYGCEFCNKAFSRKSDQVKHKRVHTKERPYSCEICKQAFSQKKSLVKHMRVHTKEKPYICEICNRAFAHTSSRVIHMRVHTKEKPYSCNICNKSFTVKCSLVKHMRVHTKEKPYTCEICNKAFSLKYVLAQHKKVHTKKQCS